MTTLRSPVTTLPPLVSYALRPLPLLPLQPLLSALLGQIVKRHPRIFERLGPYAGKRFGLAPTDLPFAFVLDTKPSAPKVTAVRSLPQHIDAKISGPLLALVGMANGDYDGDALFFSRTIVIEGDVEATLALRNAIDDAGVDIVKEGTALLGPLGQLGDAFLRRVRQGSAHKSPSQAGVEPSPWN